MGALIPIGCFVVPLIIGFFAVSRGLWWVVPTLLLGFAAVMVWAFWKGQHAQGWEGLSYIILAYLMGPPATLGAALGWCFGWIRNRKTLAAGRVGD